MGVFTYESETSSVIPPARLFKSFVLDADNLLPKVAPQAIQKIETLEGDGGVGTVKKTTFGEGSPFKFVKQKVDVVDHANFIFAYTVMEGDVVSDTIEKATYECKIVAGPNGGSILKSTTNYHTKGDNKIDEEKLKLGKERADSLFKTIESYLLANPDAYN